MHLIVQSVLYRNAPAEVERLARGVRTAAARLRERLPGSRVELALGDCSPAPVLDAAALDALRRTSPELDAVHAEWFDANLGHGGGHARLFAAHRGSHLLVLNPDVLLAPEALHRLAARLDGAAADGSPVGAVEMRQLPLEHPKAYDPASGASGWLAGAGLLLPAEVFARVDGFDHAAFPMYADDVDLSWRIRAAGYALVVEPRAVGFHDKRLNEHGGWEASELEWVSGYAAEVTMLAKWGSAELARERHEQLAASDDPRARAAAAELDAHPERWPAARTDGAGIAEPARPGYGERRFTI
ncbi:MAG: hypothetical protein Q4E05_04025 [Pseudoclavibacter sp.]|nr:hypothetical protein [Pseudoclavibacter sp.]